MTGKGLAIVGLGIAAAAVGRRLLAASVSLRRLPHESETEEAYHSAGTRILILGAGFGGIATALELDKRLQARTDTSILVVDKDNSTLFTPLLWTVADGRSNPSNIVVPVRAFQRGRRFHLLQAEVEKIDLDSRQVHTSAGTRPYDYLVIALGSVTTVPDLPGVREHALTFRSPADALQLRNHLIDALEAAHNSQDPREDAEWLTFIVGGGGDTGVELAATISDYLSSGLLSQYPWLEDAPVRVIVAGRADRLVPMSDPKSSEAVRRELERSGVEVLTGVSIESATERSVRTTRGEIPARTLFWAAGIAAPSVVSDLPVEHARNGSLIVDDQLRLPGHPEVYAIGDSAWSIDLRTGRGVPPTAQAAEHEGRYVGRAIAAAMNRMPTKPFRFRPLGHMALLGSGTGVAQVGPLTLTGPPAWLMWHSYYLSHIPSWRNRIRLLLDWLLAGLTGRETSQLRLETRSGSGETTRL